VHRGPLAELLPEWERLFAADDEATPFSSAEWARAWWPHWAGGGGAFLVTVRDAGRLVGLAPLVLGRRGPFRVLAELGRPPGNYWDVLAEPAARSQAGAEVMRALSARRSEWHALLLGGVRDGSATERAVLSGGLRLRRRRPTPYPGIELPETFDEYLAALPRKRRKDLRRHLRRLEEAGLVSSEARRGTSVGRPQTVYSAVDREAREGRDYRLFADMIAGQITGARQRARSVETAREWGAYLVGRSAPPPGARSSSGPNLAVLQAALAEAGFDPRFRRRGRGRVDITLRDCPFRELLDDHRELVCALHRGLLEGMLQGSRPPMRLGAFEPLAERSAVCRLTAVPE